MSIKIWEHFFKSEVRSNGRTLFTQGKVSIFQPSDTEVVVYVRTSPPLKVSLKTQSVSSDTIFADCNCPFGKKNLFCKHIWAGLLATEEKNPYFFESKTDIKKQKTIKEEQTTFKEKQNAYRKKLYQDQKLRLKNIKKNKNDIPAEIQFPQEVEKALFYFSQNGFELREILNKETVSVCKKKLARIFHPDRGGSHNEILDLNKYSDILMGFLNK